MTTDTDTRLRVSRLIRASPDAVFRAWTDPTQVKKWGAPEGVTIAIAEVDLQVGGAWYTRMVGPDGKEFNVRGIYRDIDAPHRLVYTFRWDEKEHDAGDTVVTVEFQEVDGSTNVVLTHEGFPGGEAKEGHNQGWTSCLNRLESLMS